MSSPAKFSAGFRPPSHATGKLEAVARDLPKAESGSIEERLATIRVLIEHDPALRIFYTSTNGFDTHAAQNFTHRELLRSVSSAVAHFLADLRGQGLGERVVVLMFSEFGLCVRESCRSKGPTTGRLVPSSSPECLSAAG